MKIEFEQLDKRHVSIIGIDTDGARLEIGHIFTPSGSGETNLNAIQICGFDEAFDLWGCGVYGDVKTKQMKKDIQLCWYGLYRKMNREEIDRVFIGTKTHITTEEQMKRLGLKKPCWTEEITENRFSAVVDGKVCHKCFNYPCTCENLDKFDNPYTVKREQDLYLLKAEDKKSSP